VPFKETEEQYVVAPSLKLTVPVGVPAPLVTVAVKATLWPKVEGEGVLTTSAMVAALFTV
jgi:hypothetical protein